MKHRFSSGIKKSLPEVHCGGTWERGFLALIAQINMHSSHIDKLNVHFVDFQAGLNVMMYKLNMLTLLGCAAVCKS